MRDDTVPRPGEDPSVVTTTYWHALDDGRVQCDVCPRHCRMRDGQRGLCVVRAKAGGAVALTTWGLDRDGRCAGCGTPCAGVFEARPGTWGGRRRPVRLSAVA